MIKKLLIFVLVLLVALPVLVWAAGDTASNTVGLVPCGNGEKMCTVADAFTLVANIVKFLLFTVAVPLCALAITVGGIKMAMYSTNPSGKEEGKKIIMNAAMGLMIALASYLLVDTVIDFFTGKSVDKLQDEVLKAKVVMVLDNNKI